MANTYTQIYMHIVFAVGRREALIADEWADELYRYLAGACKNRKHFVCAINGTADHVHLLVGMHPGESVSELVQSLKIQSTKWINDKYLNGAFGWQSGYGAFSFSKSFVPAVQKYVENQREHHKKDRFEDELKNMLDKAGVEYHSEYLMKGYANISPT